MLGLRRRRGHDLRRTFITLAQVDGARRDLLESVTHGPRGDIVSVYTSFPWPALCEEVGKLKITLREGKLLDGKFGNLATRFATNQLKSRNRWKKSVTPSGIESPEGTCKDPKRGAALRHFSQCSSGIRFRSGAPPCSAKTRQKPRQSRVSWQESGKENGRGKRPDGVHDAFTGACHPSPKSAILCW